MSIKAVARSAGADCGGLMSCRPGTSSGGEPGAPSRRAGEWSNNAEEKAAGGLESFGVERR